MLDAIPAPNGDGTMPAPAQVRHRPQFSGTAGEYFGIWFVNLLLSILTLGIYSAWAKVRTERYFYSNTRLAGASFEYLADPVAVLKGRLIAYAVVIALALTSKFAIGLYFALFLTIMALMPWVIVMSLRFRARNSAWRGLTFRFDRSGGDAYGPFMGWPLLQALTASLLYPVMKQKQHDFVAAGHWFGHRRFDYTGDTGQYYVPYAIAAGCGIVLFGGLMVAMTGAVLATGGAGQPGAVPGAGILAIAAVFYLGFFAIAAFVRVRYGNLLWNSTRLGGHRFESTARARDMIWIYATNLVAIVCTLGLAVPWAMVRLARYRADHFALVAQGSLDEFVADPDRQHGAAGAELVDALDVGADFGF